VPEQNPSPPPVAEVAAELANRLEAIGCDYALGGAVALACWAEPRGTVDVDVSLYLPIGELGETITALHNIGADFSAVKARESLESHGFCQVEFMGRRLDVFLPIAAIYEWARPRRQRKQIGPGHALVWDAETLCVFKMMFFRRKDLADVEAMLRTQGAALDHAWVENALRDMYGERDPRINQWRELVAETRDLP
jgi:hypothetical protein